MRYKKCGLSLVLSLGLLLVGFLSISVTNNTYAASISHTIDSSNYTQSFTFCDTSTTPDCSGYRYLYYKVNNMSSYFSANFSLQHWNYQINFNTNTFEGYVYFSSTNNKVSYTSLSRLPSNDISVDFILSDVDPVSGGSSPSGSISITENGTYDVSSYAEAVVEVPEEDCPEGSGGDYHQDLVNIYNAIMCCGGVLLVLYFFYCIYRMIIKSTGGK